MIPSDLAQSRGDIMREIADLKRQIQELRAERKLGASTIESGTLRVVDNNGTIVALIGDLSEFSPGQRGFWLGRPGPEPSQAISVFGTGEGGDSGFVGVWDREGNYIVTDDAESGRGLGRPYLPVTFAEITAPTATTTSATFTDLAIGYGPLHHPVLYVLLLVQSGAGTAGEARITLNGAAVGAVATIGTAVFTTATIGPFDVPTPPDYSQINDFRIQARRTAGANSVGVRVISVLCVESAYAP